MVATYNRRPSQRKQSMMPQIDEDEFDGEKKYRDLTPDGSVGNGRRHVFSYEPEKVLPSHNNCNSSSAYQKYSVRSRYSLIEQGYF